jgi:hypothetical protein
MSRNYKFHNQEGVYFISFAVIEWLDARLIARLDEQFGQGRAGIYPK